MFQPKLTQISEIQATKKNNGVAAFIGAGCSAALKIPLWSQMLVELNNLFPYYQSAEAVEADIQNVGFYRVASNIYKKSPGEREYQDALRMHANPSSCYFTSLHLEILYMTNTIVTTNYDKSFENALDSISRYGDENSCKYNSSTLAGFDMRGLGDRRHIYHIHGDKDKANMMITTESYQKYYGDKFSSLSNLVSTVFWTFPTIFIGFSFDDTEFVNLLEQVIVVISKEKIEAAREPIKHYSIMAAENTIDYILSSEIDNNFIEAFENQGILSTDNRGADRFIFTHDAPSLILGTNLKEEEKDTLINKAKTLLNRKNKLDLFKTLNIEVVTFESGAYIQIEEILQAINKKVETVAATFQPK